MKRHTAATALSIACALLLTGCGTAAAAGPATAPDAAMETEMSHSGHATEGPSEAARMICSPDIQHSVAAALGLATAPDPQDTWTNGVYTCTYPVPDGTLVLSVMEMADDASAEAHAAELKGSFDGAEDIVGLENLGLPAYQTPDGVVLFVKDNAMLQVDAREALATDDGEISRTGLAYRIATNVLACWKAHH